MAETSEQTDYDGAPTSAQLGLIFTIETNPFFKGVVSSYLDQYPWLPGLFVFVPQSKGESKKFEKGRAARWGLKALTLHH